MIARRVRVRPAAAERTLVTLLELAPAGFEEREGEGRVEYVLYGAADELPSAALLRVELGEVLLGIADSEVADDWGERWKSWHRPVEVSAAGGRRARIRPPWEPPATDEPALELVIDPGQAFGTGGHETTRLCLQLLLERPARGSFADWGCGTGVLALAAARLGWRPVVAVDADPAALEATRTNAEVNGIRGVAVQQHDLARGPAPLADTVVANLVLPLLLEVAAAMRHPPPVLIASGLLIHQVDVVCDGFARHGLREAIRRHSGEWAAVVLERA